MKGAKNVEQAEAWINYGNQPRTAARIAEYARVNPVSTSAVEFYSDSRRAFFQQAYSTGGGGDPCKLKECRCKDRTCSVACCNKDEGMSGSLFWWRPPPLYLREVEQRALERALRA